MLVRIEAVQQDAEEREIHDRSVRLWLEELRGVAYQAEDVLDEFYYEVLKSFVDSGDAAIEAYHREKDSGALESLGYKQGYRIDVDVPDEKWAEAPKFHHILLFNTGHWWWAPSKFDPVQSPMLFFQNGVPVIPPLTPPLGMELALKHMLRYIENLVGPEKFLFFRTQSPRHFEGGDWNAGGSSWRDQALSIDEVGELFSLERNSTNVEYLLVNQHLFKALKGSRFHILDITSMSVFIADAHPSTTGGKRHEDCMHWCLPGLPDIWNDLFVVTLETLQIK